MAAYGKARVHRLREKGVETGTTAVEISSAKRMTSDF
jgi:hypothetical protein